MKKSISLFVIILIFPAFVAHAATLAEQLSGKILLQVEENGEAWYVNPADQHRYFLGRPVDAFSIMRELGIGISNENLNKIPANMDYKDGVDTDGDGLSNDFEIALGTNPELSNSDGDSFSDRDELSSGFSPNGNGNLPIDTYFADKQKGKIFLQVEAHGEAWYVNPSDGERYFLGRPIDAFSLMRSLGLGITNENLNNIVAGTAGYSASDLELKMFEAINQERTLENKVPLIWNNDLANVAREHSQDLVNENNAFVGEGMSCEFPIIHHEGLIFGVYNAERLNNRGVNYYSSAGENIALVPTVSTIVLFKYYDPLRESFDTCPARREVLDVDFKKRLDQEENIDKKIIIINNEIVGRTEAFKKEYPLQIEKQTWHSLAEVVSETVKGWMNSPGHKANILDKKYTESGIGVASVDGYLISTQVFIKRAKCGYQDGACCEDDGYYPYCFTGLNCELSICK